LARFPAVHVRQRLGADGINLSLLLNLRLRTVYMVGAGRCAPMGPLDGGGGSWRRRIGDPPQSVLRAGAPQVNVSKDTVTGSHRKHTKLGNKTFTHLSTRCIQLLSKALTKQGYICALGHKRRKERKRLGQIRDHMVISFRHQCRGTGLIEYERARELSCNLLGPHTHNLRFGEETVDFYHQYHLINRINQSYNSRFVLRCRSQRPFTAIRPTTGSACRRSI